MSKKKYYVVWDGRETGVFDSWELCNEQVGGYPGAVYKSFGSEDEAHEAYYQDSKDHVGNTKKKPPLTAEQIREYGEPIQESISVDGASSSRGGMSEYRGVQTHNAHEIFRAGPFPEGTNNIGEFLALVHGLAFLKKNESSRIMYTDSKIAMSWVKKKTCNTKLPRNPKNEGLFELVDRAVSWLKTNTYNTTIVKWETKAWGEIPADFGRK